MITIFDQTKQNNDMKANELRIGNRLIFIDDEVVVSGIENYLQYTDKIYCNGFTRPQSISHFKPIQLTEDWLLNFGFEFDGGCSWWKDEIEMTIDVGEDEYSAFNSDGNYITMNGIKYVHSLQNLYFAIKGEELTLTK